MPRRERPSQSDLMLVAKQLGYGSRKEAIEVLRNNGVQDKFDPEEYGEYVAILTTHARTLTSILNKLENSNQSQGKNTDRNAELPARAERVMRALGQRPWLLKPVAQDDRGQYRFLDDREEIKDNETLVYEGVTKREHLDFIAEMQGKEKADAVDTGKSGVSN